MKVLFSFLGLIAFCMAQVVPEPKQSLIPCHSYVALKAGARLPIKTENYPNNFPLNSDSNQCFTSPQGTRMTLTCSSFDIKEYAVGSEKCFFDYMYLSQNGDRSYSTTQHFCGKMDCFTPITSGGNSMMVGYHISHNGTPRPGFDCAVTVSETPTTTSAPVVADPQVPCHQNILLTKVGDQASMKTDNFPANYPKNSDSNKCIGSPPGTKLKLSCSTFAMSATCPSLGTSSVHSGDYLYVSQNGDKSYKNLQRFCGNSFSDMISTDNKIQVGYHTDVAGSTNKGMDCVVTVVAALGCSSTNP